jgi:hypothetical protein
MSAGMAPSPSPSEVDLLEGVLQQPPDSLSLYTPLLHPSPNTVIRRPQSVVLDKDDPLAISFRERFRSWFYHAPWEDICRENVRSWVAWSCFGCSKEEALERQAYSDVMEEALELIEARTGCKLPEGNNEDVKVMRLTLGTSVLDSVPSLLLLRIQFASCADRLMRSTVSVTDKVHVRHRPLILYTLTALINFAAEHLVYRRMGLRRTSVEGMESVLSFSFRSYSSLSTTSQPPRARIFTHISGSSSPSFQLPRLHPSLLDAGERSRRRRLGAHRLHPWSRFVRLRPSIG